MIQNQKASDEQIMQMKNRLLAYKKIYEGKRCFIIGTAPSLTVGDLDLLKERKELTFSCNKIYQVYTETLWRPDIYFVGDDRFINQNYEDIVTKNKGPIIMFTIKEPIIDKRVIWAPMRWPREGKFGALEFSDHVERNTIIGPTIVYLIIQWAVYMGCNPIYLLGVDNYYSSLDGKGNKDHFCEDYVKKGESRYKPEPDLVDRAFKQTRDFVAQRGVQVINATRGGRVEWFPRVSIDKLLNA